MLPVGKPGQLLFLKTQCDGKFCGDDGCGGQCATCAAGEICNTASRCVSDPCVPQCGGRTLARDVMDDTLGAVVGPGVSDYVGNYSAFLADFPFLAEPNAAAALKATASPVKAAPARVLRVAPRERAMPRRTRLHGAR